MGRTYAFEAFLLFVLLWPFLVYYLLHIGFGTPRVCRRVRRHGFRGRFDDSYISGAAAFAVTLILSSRIKMNKAGLGHHTRPWQSLVGL